MKVITSHVRFLPLSSTRRTWSVPPPIIRRLSWGKGSFLYPAMLKPDPMAKTRTPTNTIVRPAMAPAGGISSGSARIPTGLSFSFLTFLKVQTQVVRTKV